MTETKTAVAHAPEMLPADPMVMMIERIALDPNSDLAKLEKMLDMKERLDAKAARRAFDLAMADAKSEIPPILKTGTVDYTNTKSERIFFKHETLAGIAATVDPILSKHGLSYRYRSKQENGQLFVTCIIAHKDGFSEETTLQGGPDAGAGKNNYQAVGSAVTYLQRYTLKLALGLSAALDDDAGGANENVAETISADQFVQIRDRADLAGVDHAKICAAAGVSELHMLLAKDFASVMARLQKTIDAKRGAA
jgi:hypothetical protein